MNTVYYCPCYNEICQCFYDLADAIKFANDSICEGLKFIVGVGCSSRILPEYGVYSSPEIKTTLQDIFATVNFDNRQEWDSFKLQFSANYTPEILPFCSPFDDMFEDDPEDGVGRYWAAILQKEYTGQVNGQRYGKL